METDNEDRPPNDIFVKISDTDFVIREWLKSDRLTQIDLTVIGLALTRTGVQEI